MNTINDPDGVMNAKSPKKDRKAQFTVEYLRLPKDPPILEPNLEFVRSCTLLHGLLGREAVQKEKDKLGDIPSLTPQKKARWPPVMPTLNPTAPKFAPMTEDEKRDREIVDTAWKKFVAEEQEKNKPIENATDIGEWYKLLTRDADRFHSRTEKNNQGAKKRINPGGVVGNELALSENSAVSIQKVYAPFWNKPEPRKPGRKRNVALPGNVLPNGVPNPQAPPAPRKDYGFYIMPNYLKVQPHMPPAQFQKLQQQVCNFMLLQYQQAVAEHYKTIPPAEILSKKQMLARHLYRPGFVDPALYANNPVVQNHQLRFGGIGLAQNPTKNPPTNGTKDNGLPH